MCLQFTFYFLLRSTNQMHELPETRESLLVQLRNQSNDAWGEFLAIYEQAIFAFCRRQGLQDADARDVTQDVLLAIHHRIDAWDSDPAKGKLRGWLFRVARNITVNKLLERGKRMATGDSATRDLLTQLPDSSAAQETLFSLEYRRTVMHWAANQVKPVVNIRSWQAFWNTAIEGKSAQKTAGELGMSVGSVYTAKCRVFARIKKVVAMFDDDTNDLHSQAPEGDQQ